MAEWVVKDVAVGWMMTRWGVEGRAFQAAIEHDRRWVESQLYQALMNNLWDNNPGELDRWADDGGKG